MSPTDLTYNEQNIRHFYDLLEAESARGRARDFEVRLDGKVMIPRTNNPALLLNILTLVSPFTREVALILYKKGSQWNDKYSFHCQDSEPVLSGAPLTGAEVDKLVEERLERKSKEDELLRLREENQKMKGILGKQEEELQAMEKEITALRQQVGELEQKKNPLAGIKIEKLAGSALEHVARKNPDWVRHIPIVGEVIADQIEGENEERGKGKRKPKENTQGKSTVQLIEEEEPRLTGNPQAVQPPPPAETIDLERSLEFMEYAVKEFFPEQEAKLREMLEFMQKNKDDFNVALQLVREQQFLNK